MKKLFLLGALAFCATINAQTEKGSWVVSGSTTIGFNNTSSKIKYGTVSYDGPKVTTFNITPSAGYFVINKLAVGMDVAFTSTKSKNTEYYSGESLNYETNSSTVVVMPTGTYYFKSASKVMPYLGAGIGYFSNTTKFSSDYYSSLDTKTTTDGLAWGAKGGLVLLITPSIGVDLGLSYINTSSKEGEIKNITNSLGANAGFSFFFK